jgi:hypothetical protein
VVVLIADLHLVGVVGLFLDFAVDKLQLWLVCRQVSSEARSRSISPMLAKEGFRSARPSNVVSGRIASSRSKTIIPF